MLGEESSISNLQGRQERWAAGATALLPGRDLLHYHTESPRCEGTGGRSPSQRAPRPPTSPHPMPTGQDERGQAQGKGGGAESATPGPSSLLQRFSEELVGAMIVLKYR